MLSYFDTAHQLRLLAGTPAESWFQSGYIGDDDVFTLRTKVRLRFAQGYKPTTAAIQTYRGIDGANYEGSTAQMDGTKFDVLDTAKWHLAGFTFTGLCRVEGIDSTLVEAGTA